MNQLLKYWPIVLSVCAILLWSTKVSALEDRTANLEAHEKIIEQMAIDAATTRNDVSWIKQTVIAIQDKYDITVQK